MSHASSRPSEHKPVPITADTSHLSANEQKILALLKTAVAITNDIYLDQMRQNFSETGGCIDKTRGTNFYPDGITREEIKMYLTKHPEERKAILSPFTVVEKKGGRLTATPLSEYYSDEFEQIAGLFEETAQYAEEGSFKTFLQSRAQSFRTNEYRQSDIDWVRVSDAPIELTIGPHESYADDLFNIKRDVEAVLGVVLPEETQEANVYREEIVAFDKHLGEYYGYTAATVLTPMIVIDEVQAGGDPWYGYIPIAYNLPNDEDILKEVGSKKVFIRNVMRAKMEHITKPIAERVLDAQTLKRLETQSMMRFVIGHEASHGLSFSFDGNDFYELALPLEEGKADVFGMCFLYFLVDRGVVTKQAAENAVISNFTSGLTQVRFDESEAHAIGMFIQYNHFLKAGALEVAEGKLVFHPECFDAALKTLSDAFYELAQAKDYEKASAFVIESGVLPEEIKSLVSGLTDIPIDIDPIFEE